MKNLFIILFISFSIINISAQIENGNGSPKEEIIFVDQDDDVVTAPTVVVPSSSAETFLNQSDNRKIYKVFALYKNFDWIQSKKNKKVGIIKNGKMFLPVVFSADTKQKGKCFILEYKNKKGAS